MNDFDTSKYAENKTGVSFEFFPPRNATMLRKFWRTVGRLEALRPDFFSVTYGALGSGREQSLNTVRDLCSETGVPVAAHLTCAGSSRDALNATIDDLLSYGIQGIVALRGDGEDPEQPYQAAADGY
ncbi:MAG: methylenetetrahydrofolate reductase, partial [Gammaproteobacteria bacterium]|nr:methylenetetrahydrofolate reductase [Gammaproteobacteria bacterium]